MAFILGNHSIDEILYGAAQNSDGDLLYTLDQLTTAEIAISAESTDITDKKGNVVRTVYTSKTGEFTATNAFLHPQVLNASSGTKIDVASSTKKISMPKFNVIAAGEKCDVAGRKEGTLRVVGLYGNGANATPMDSAAAEALVSANKFVAPQGGEGLPIQYFVMFEREVEEGIKLSNDAQAFPDLVKLTLLASYVDPCADELKPCYVVIPRFMASPEVTISLDRENQEVDFNGNLNIDYCSPTKALYYIYYPEDSKVIEGAVA